MHTMMHNRSVDTVRSHSLHSNTLLQASDKLIKNNEESSKSEH